MQKGWKKGPIDRSTKTWAWAPALIQQRRMHEAVPFRCRMNAAQWRASLVSYIHTYPHTHEQFPNALGPRSGTATRSASHQPPSGWDQSSSGPPINSSASWGAFGDINSYFPFLKSYDNFSKKERGKSPFLNSSLSFFFIFIHNSFFFI